MKPCILHTVSAYLQYSSEKDKIIALDVAITTLKVFHGRFLEKGSDILMLLQLVSLEYPRKGELVAWLQYAFLVIICIFMLKKVLLGLVWKNVLNDKRREKMLQSRDE